MIMICIFICVRRCRLEIESSEYPTNNVQYARSMTTMDIIATEYNIICCIAFNLRTWKHSLTQPLASSSEWVQWQK